MMIKNGIFTFLAAAAIAMAAACSTATGFGHGAASKALGPQSQAEQASPYAQPLMATGGDLVMLHVPPQGIAEGWSGC